MKREWLIWKRRPILWALLAIVVVMAYLGFFGYESYDTWIRNKMLMEDWSYGGEEGKAAAFDALWMSMSVNMVNKLMNLVVPVVMVVFGLGADIKKRRVEKLSKCGASLPRLYGQNFLFAFLVSSILAVLGFFFQMHRLHLIWENSLDGSEMGILLRILIYLLVLTFYLTAAAQLVCVLFSKIHIVVPVVVSVPFVIVLAQPVLLLAKVFAKGLPKEELTIASYLGYDIPQGILEKDYVPVVTDAAAVRMWGTVLQIGLVLAGVLCLIAGLLYFKQTAKKTAEIGKNTLTVNPLPQAGEVFAICQTTAGVSEEDFIPEEPFVYEKMDIWENLQSIQLACGKEDVAKVRKIVGLAGLDGIGTRKRAIDTYPDGMYRCYVLAVALLAEPDILVTRGILDGLGNEDFKEVKEALLRLKEEKLPLLLYNKNEANVEGIADKIL